VSGTLRFLEQGVPEDRTPFLISALCASQGEERISRLSREGSYAPVLLNKGGLSRGLTFAAFLRVG